MLTDAYTKGLLTIIAISCSVMAYQSLMAFNPEFPEPCGSETYSPCFAVAAEPEGLMIASGDGGINDKEPIMVRVIDHEPVSVNVVGWSYRNEVDVEVTNWP